MKLSIRNKTAIFLLVLVLAVGGVSTYLHIHSRIQARYEELKTRAYSMAQVIGLLFTDQLLTGVPVGETQQIQMNVWLSQMKQTKFLSVYNSDGEVIYSNKPGDKYQDFALDLPPDILQRALHSQKRQTSRSVPELDTMDMLIPIRLFRTDFGLIRLGYDTSKFREDRNRIIYYYGSIGVVAILLAFLLSNRLAGAVVEQIEKLDRVAHKLGDGELGARADIRSGDELEDLGNTFNSMAERLQKKVEDLQTLQELSRKISAKLRPEDLHDHIVHILHESWNLSHINLLLHEDSSKDTLQVEAGVNVDAAASVNLESHVELAKKLEDLDNFERFSSLSEYPGLQDLFADSVSSLTEGIIFKLKTDTFEIGYLLLGRNERNFSEDEINLISTLTHQIKVALENARHYLRAITDDLTGLYNRSFFDLELKEQLGRKDTATSLLMIDIDDFKRYNDSFGHPAGDEVLKKLAKTFQEQVRTTDTHGTARKPDLVCRYGGEEFAVILPETMLDEAANVGERIRGAVEKLGMFEIPVTISLGAAEAREGEGTEELIGRADRALYRAKENGKNQVCLEKD